MKNICQVCAQKIFIQDSTIDSFTEIKSPIMRSVINTKRNIVSESTTSNGIPASMLKEISLLKMLNHENVDGILSVMYHEETISFEYKCRIGIPLQDLFYTGQRLPITSEVLN
jgi:hypothetical protein